MPDMTVSSTSRTSPVLSEEARDPEARVVDECNPAQVREKMQDKTDADSFPASDPPSSIPDPVCDSFAA